MLKRLKIVWGNSNNPGHVVKFGDETKQKDYHMYTGLKSQLDFSDNLMNNILPQHHDLIKLKNILNWKKINSIYKKCFPSKKGRSTKRTELIIGLILLKFLYKRSDRQLIEELEVNNAFMYFCSINHADIALLQLKNLKRKKPVRLIDHSTLVKARKKLGVTKIKEIESLFTNELIKNKIIEGKQLFIDTTSLEKNILYPTEISLLKRVIEHAEMIVQKVALKKDLMKSEVIKKTNQICKVYYSAGKKTKNLLSTTSKQLVQIAENILISAKKTMDNIPDEIKKSLAKNYQKVISVGKTIVNQVCEKINGNSVPDKIVSYYESHARALPKGKIHKACEFGSKLEINMSKNGYITRHVLHNGNPSDVGMLEAAVAHHYKKFKEEFKEGAADRGFYDNALIENLKITYNIKLAIPHKKNNEIKMNIGEIALYKKRAAIEAKISEGKRCYGLNKSLFKGNDGDTIWETLSVFALNAKKLLKDISGRPELIERFST